MDQIESQEKNMEMIEISDAKIEEPNMDEYSNNDEDQKTDEELKMDKDSETDPCLKKDEDQNIDEELKTNKDSDASQSQKKDDQSPRSRTKCKLSKGNYSKVIFFPFKSLFTG